MLSRGHSSSSSSLLVFFATATLVALLVLLTSTTTLVDAATGAADVLSESHSEGGLLPTDDPIPEEPHREFHNIKVGFHDDQVTDPDKGATDDMSDHEAMRCLVCRQAVVPTLVTAISQRAGKGEDHKELVFGELRKLAHKHAYDMVSKTTVLREVPSEKAAGTDSAADKERDENIHHFIEDMLWDEHLSSQVIAFADVWVQQPRRRHWFRRLIDHAICPCHDGKDILRLDEGIDKYIMNHIAASTEVQKKYKIGHEIFEQDVDRASLQTSNREFTSGNPVEDSDAREDADKRKHSSSVGTVWVDQHDQSAYDESATRQHMESQTVLSSEHNLGQEGAGGYVEGEEGYHGDL